MKLARAFAAGSCFVAALAVAQGAQASVRVGGYSLRANGDLVQHFQYTGSCPVDLKFGWGLVGTKPAPVSYTFTRSDGGHSSSQGSADLARANQSVPVYYDWKLGANNPKFANFKGWVELDVNSPNHVVKRVNFTLHCR
jgi:hypothetical protein